MMDGTQIKKVKIRVIFEGKLGLEKEILNFPITIGRHPDSIIPLVFDRSVSTHHATIVENEGSVILVDLGSANGTYLDGKRVDKSHISGLHRIRIGHSDIEVSIAKDDAPIISTAAIVEDQSELPTVYDFSDSGAQDSQDVGRPDWGFRMVQKIPVRTRRALQARVTWKDQTIENHVFYPGETVCVSSNAHEGIYLPHLDSTIPIAKFDGEKTKILIPPTCSAEVIDVTTQKVTKKLNPDIAGKFRKTAFKNNELKLDFENDLSIRLEHIQTPEQFSRFKFFLPEKLFQKALSLSGFVHLFILSLGLLLIPPIPVPKVKNMPDRVAKLLIPQPKPIEKKVEPPPPPPAPPEKKQVVEKRVEPKKRVPPKVADKKPKIQPQKVVVKPNERIKKINKFPFTVETKNVAKAPSKGAVTNKPDIKNVGALAALGALGVSTPNPTNKPVAINVNPNAGGAPGPLQANSVIGALKQKGGKLVAGGSGSLKTTGKGFGTGTGYGVDGIQGTAGARGVAATVVGTPQLMEITKEEGLTQQQVMEVVKKNSGLISSCYERALLNNPSLSGRVEYSWHIKPNGQVSWAKVKNSNIAGADELNNCVVGIFKKMKFPVAKNGQETIPSIGFPFGRL